MRYERLGSLLSLGRMVYRQGSMEDEATISKLKRGVNKAGGKSPRTVYTLVLNVRRSVAAVKTWLY